MRQEPDKNRKTLVLDFDGIFYSWKKIYGGMPQAMDFCGNIKADVVPLILNWYNSDKAFAEGKRSYKETGDGLRYFIDSAREKGYTEAELEEVREQIHTLYHQRQLTLVRERYPELLKPCPETSRLFNSLSNLGYRFAVISQSCRESWLYPVLEGKNIIQHFDPKHIFGFKEFGWHEKSVNAKGLGIVMEAIKATPNDVIFFEDTKKNLKPVKDEYPEVQTTHIEDWEVASPEDTHIDLSVKTTVEGFRLLADLHQDPTLYLQRRHDSLGLHP